MQVYNSAPQISGFDAAEVEKISSGNNVQPVTITVDKLLDFACMPVKIENVTIETAGIWKTEVDKASTHTFKANGSDLTVYINKGASSFNNVAYIAKENGSLTGIAAAYKTSAQLLPRNLEDVKEFEATGPTITSVAPSQVNFPSTGGEETLQLLCGLPSIQQSFMRSTISSGAPEKPCSSGLLNTQNHERETESFFIFDLLSTEIL